MLSFIFINRPLNLDVSTLREKFINLITSFNLDLVPTFVTYRTFINISVLTAPGATAKIDIFFL